MLVDEGALTLESAHRETDGPCDFECSYTVRQRNNVWQFRFTFELKACMRLTHDDRERI
jgi:hypothetical protein